MPSVAITSPTLTSSMPRSRKSPDAARTAFRRVRAASSRERRTVPSRRVEPELLAERAVEDARRQVSAQPRQQARALARGVAQAWLFRGGRLEHHLRHDLRILAAVDVGAALLASAPP